MYRKGKATFDTLDAKLKGLREEARGGYGKDELRRNLIKAQLDEDREETEKLQRAAMFGTTSTGQSCGPAEVLPPSLWTQGTFGDTEEARDVERVLAATTEVREGLYPQLCALAADYRYDHAVDERERRVLERDPETGAPTAWTTTVKRPSSGAEPSASRATSAPRGSVGFVGRHSVGDVRAVSHRPRKVSRGGGIAPAAAASSSAATTVVAKSSAAGFVQSLGTRAAGKGRRSPSLSVAPPVTRRASSMLESVNEDDTLLDHVTRVVAGTALVFCPACHACVVYEPEPDREAVCDHCGHALPQPQRQQQQQPESTPVAAPPVEVVAAPEGADGGTGMDSVGFAEEDGGTFQDALNAFRRMRKEEAAGRTATATSTAVGTTDTEAGGTEDVGVGVGDSSGGGISVRAMEVGRWREILKGLYFLSLKEEIFSTA